jgi:hypothetical protein
MNVLIFNFSLTFKSFKIHTEKLKIIIFKYTILALLKTFCVRYGNQTTSNKL